MITKISVTICSIKNLKSTRNSLFHKYAYTDIYVQFSLPKTCKTRGGRFSAL